MERLVNNLKTNGFMYFIIAVGTTVVYLQLRSLLG